MDGPEPSGMLFGKNLKRGRIFGGSIDGEQPQAGPDEKDREGQIGHGNKNHVIECLHGLGPLI